MLELQVEQAVQQWYRHAAGESSRNRRKSGRRPFFHPVTLSIDGDSEAQRVAFTRDISPTGIGLLHRMPVSVQRQVVLTLPMHGGHQVQVRAEIVWCVPCGEGWYLSGARSLGLAAGQTLALLVEATLKGLRRYLDQSYPFFRAVTIQFDGRRVRSLHAFSRDISLLRIGLIHPRKLDSQGVRLSIPDLDGQTVIVPAQISACRPLGDGLFLSVGQYTGLDLMELEQYNP